MTERLYNRYQPLFQVRLLHHFWLDEGATLFDLMANGATRDLRLLSHDRRIFMEVTPTATSAGILADMGAIYRDTGTGFIVAVLKDKTVAADATLEFIASINDAAFFDYTALTLRPQKIYEIYYQPENTVYRYKENVPVLSNLTGVSRQLGPDKALFLSGEFPAPAADNEVEALVLSGGVLSQLTGDQPGAGLQQLGSQAANLPVFVHQGDPPAIVPPPGLTGAPPRGVRLSADIPDGVFAVIRLSAAAVGDFGFVDGNGHPLTTNPVFQVRFKNRSTIRRYFDKNTGAFIAEEPEPLPLTNFGNAGSRQKPSEGLVRAEESGIQITRLVSEIFI